MASPLLLAGIGGLFSQLAGVLNIALEGLMLFSAFFSIIGAMASGSVFVGTLVGVAAAVLLAALFATLSLGLKANIFFAGLATNLFASGFTVLLQSFLFHEKGAITLSGIPKLAAISIPGVGGIPHIGPILSGYTVFEYLSWVVAVVAFFLIRKTTLGLRIRVGGGKPGCFPVNRTAPWQVPGNSNPVQRPYLRTCRGRAFVFHVHLCGRYGKQPRLDRACNDIPGRAASRGGCGRCLAFWRDGASFVHPADISNPDPSLLPASPAVCSHDRCHDNSRYDKKGPNRYDSS